MTMISVGLLFLYIFFQLVDVFDREKVKLKSLLIVLIV